jgi:hypothetical protein
LTFNGSIVPAVGHVKRYVYILIEPIFFSLVGLNRQALIFSVEAGLPDGLFYSKNPILGKFWRVL